MTSAAAILPFQRHADGHGSRTPRNEGEETFAPFVDPGVAERMLAEGPPGDELQAFLRRSLDRLGHSAPVQAREPFLPAQPYAASGQGHREAGALPPEHPAYEAPRPAAPVDAYALHPAYGGDGSGGLHGRHPAFAAPVDPFPGPAPQRPPASVAGAPESDGTSFDIPAFLRARPGIPRPPAGPEAVPQAPSAPASLVQAAPRAPARAARTPGALTAASEMAWIYSVFPVVLILQLLAGFGGGSLTAFAATVAFAAYAAVGAWLRPALFQLRVAAGWQFVTAASLFGSLDTASPEQWMHLFAVSAATAAVVVAMGGIEVHDRLRGR
ncbi:hypothetical protein BHAOGJBA_1183 [Methylobacterium hispanicum]|uniref:Uncharacterized protein n=1 Tax=Methylobacterium hispanicum TaxID=270350 RepID=A0AAV4ZIE1_9HYPH|nr:hypothetical protein [Methylobacterium hispanicum]GJD87678.1 hypothetical protein BHAOGJBA_1183 [Methylobacterium hispanicum]